MANQLSIFLQTNLEDVLNQKIQSLFEAKLKKPENKKERLYFTLYKSIRRGIVRAEIPQECTLPPTRKLAKALNVSRSTVVKAYDLLAFEGFTEPKVGSGSIVKSTQSIGRKQIKIPKVFKYPEISERGKSFLDNSNLINTTNDKNVAFRPGVPPLDIFPVNKWKNLSNLYWRNIKSLALSYSASSGNEQLKKSIATYLNLSRNLKCSSRQIIIVSGSLQSLYLISNVLVNRGDRVIIEEPTFPNVISIFTSMGAKILGQKLDHQGLEIPNRNDKENQLAKILHLTPSSHYPTGVKMSLNRRKEMLDWAHQNGTFIIENDYEHEINNSKDELPSIFSLDKQQRTIYLGTFNRLLHPSIRLGYMVVPPYLLEAVEALLNHSHRFVATSIQVVFKQFMEQKRLYDHVKNVIDVADHRKRVFMNEFEKAFNGKFELMQSDTPSLHLLLKFKNPEVDDVALVKHLNKHNVLAHSYSKCFSSNQKERGLIFGYSSVRDPIIRNRINQMKDGFDSFFL